MKTMIMPLYANVILRPYENNPYVEMTSKEGLILTDDQFNSQDSGEVEKLDLMIGCAEVVEVGPDCKYLKPGDDVFYNILYWTGLLSVNIGLINLFPLPALDGGRLAFLGYEGVTRKKATPKVENTIHNIGFILLMGLFVVVLISDIVKCF